MKPRASSAGKDTEVQPPGGSATATDPEPVTTVQCGTPFTQEANTTTGGLLTFLAPPGQPIVVDRRSLQRLARSGDTYGLNSTRMVGQLPGLSDHAAAVVRAAW
jgi:hypothetical protein